MCTVCSVQSVMWTFTFSIASMYGSVSMRDCRESRRTHQMRDVQCSDCIGVWCTIWGRNVYRRETFDNFYVGNVVYAIVIEKYTGNRKERKKERKTVEQQYFSQKFDDGFALYCHNTTFSFNQSSFHIHTHTRIVKNFDLQPRIARPSRMHDMHETYACM